jgi:hypothetical protein
LLGSDFFHGLRFGRRCDRRFTRGYIPPPRWGFGLSEIPYLSSPSDFHPSDTIFSSSVAFALFDPEFQAAFNQWQDHLEQNCRARLLTMTGKAANAVEKAVEGGDAKTALQLLKGMGWRGKFGT